MRLSHFLVSLFGLSICLCLPRPPDRDGSGGDALTLKNLDLHESGVRQPSREQRAKYTQRDALFEKARRTQNMETSNPRAIVTDGRKDPYARHNQVQRAREKSRVRDAERAPTTPIPRSSGRHPYNERQRQATMRLMELKEAQEKQASRAYGKHHASCPVARKGCSQA